MRSLDKKQDAQRCVLICPDHLITVCSIGVSRRRYRLIPACSLTSQYALTHVLKPPALLPFTADYQRSSGAFSVLEAWHQGHAVAIFRSLPQLLSTAIVSNSIGTVTGHKQARRTDNVGLCCSSSTHWKLAWRLQCKLYKDFHIIFLPPRFKSTMPMKFNMEVPGSFS